jgi:hypothetical protein
VGREKWEHPAGMVFQDEMDDQDLEVCAEHLAVQESKEKRET